jgi:hypothetical protein
VKAVIAGLVTGLLIAAAWLALFPGVQSEAPGARALPPTLSPVHSAKPLPQPANVAIQAALHAEANDAALAPATPIAPPAQPATTLPGFTAGPPPRSATTDAAASERNRRFLEAVNARARASR